MSSPDPMPTTPEQREANRLKAQRHRQRYPEKHRAAVRKHYQRNRERLLAAKRARLPGQRPKTNKEYLRTYYEKNKIALRAKGRQYHKDHSEQLCKKTRDWHKANSERRWAYCIQKKFGITKEEYARLLKKQKGCCAVCKRPPTGRFKRLAVDHCHKTKKIRGLLCSGCNRAMGYLGDSPQTLQRAVNYLRGVK